MSHRYEGLPVTSFVPVGKRVFLYFRRDEKTLTEEVDLTNPARPILPAGPAATKLLLQ